MHFFVKLIPRRPTFPHDMTADEQQIMLRHRDYWTELMHKKAVLLFGPVLDPAGVFGMGVVDAQDEATARALMEDDPAIVLNRYEFHPMRAIHSGQNKDVA